MKLNLKKVFLLVSLISVNAFAQVTADPSRPTIFSDSTNVQTVPMQNSSGKQVLETVVVPGDDAVIKWGGGIISGTGIKYFSLSNKITATSLRVEYARGTVSQASGGKSLGKSAGNNNDLSAQRVCTVDTCGSCWTPAVCNFHIVDGNLWNGGSKVPGNQYTILDSNGNPIQIVSVENGGLNFTPVSGGTGSGGDDGGGSGGGSGGGGGGDGGGDCGDEDGQQPCDGDNAVHKKS